MICLLLLVACNQEDIIDATRQNNGETKGTVYKQAADVPGGLYQCQLTTVDGDHFATTMVLAQVQDGMQESINVWYRHQDTQNFRLLEFDRIGQIRFVKVDRGRPNFLYGSKNIERNAEGVQALSVTFDRSLKEGEITDDLLLYGDDGQVIFPPKPENSQSLMAITDCSVL
jgi:hypothetical protein